MTPAERSEKLRKEADEVLELIHLQEYCSDIGDIILTGSCYLDLMIYPDIDLYLPETSPENLMEVGKKLSALNEVVRINFMKGGIEGLEKGIYLKPEIVYGNWERNWKVDIWSVDESVIEAKQRILEGVKHMMSDEQKQIILEYKFSILNDSGRTPVFSGYYTYRAVIEEKLTDFTDITEYLRKNGVEV